MNVWRLEWLRLVRTRRLVALVAVYAFFGAVGPFIARYSEELVNRFANDQVTVVLAPPKPVDGLTEFASQSGQLGLLVVVLIAAAALAFDGQRESAVFLRTRVRSTRAIVLPRFVASSAVATAAFLLGTAIAWYETWALLGAVDAGRVIAGALLGALFLVFAVAVVAGVSSLTRSVLTTALGSLGVLIGTAIVGSVIPAAGRWLPTHLAGALTSVVSTGDIGSFVTSTAVTAILTAMLVVTSWIRLDGRDI